METVSSTVLSIAIRCKKVSYQISSNSIPVERYFPKHLNNNCIRKHRDGSNNESAQYSYFALTLDQNNFYKCTFILYSRFVLLNAIVNLDIITVTRDFLFFKHENNS